MLIVETPVASAAPSGAAGGDLSGTYPNPAIAALAVSKLQAGTSAQILNNSVAPAAQWITVSGDLTLSATGSGTVSAVNGTTVPAAPSASQVLVATNSTAAAWGTLSNASIATAAAIAVSKLAAGTAGQILQNNATPTPVWVSMSGDVTISNTGAATVGAIGGAAPVVVTNAMALGAGTVAAAGSLRSSNNTNIVTARNAANGGDIVCVGTNASDQILFGEGTNTANLVFTVKSGGSTAYTFSSTTAEQMFSTGILMRNTGVGFQFNGEVAASTINHLAQNSTSAGSGANGVAMTVGSQPGQAATGAAHNGGNGSDLTIGGGAGGTSGSATAGIGGSLKVSGGLKLGQVTKSANYTCDTGSTTADLVVYMTGNAFTLTLPTPTAGRIIIAKDAAGNASSQNKTVAPHGAETIDGAASYVLNLNNVSVVFQSDATNWFVLAVYNGTVV